LASIFPGSPSLNDIFTSNGTTWQWNGEAWVVVADEGQTFNTVITSPTTQTISADAGSDTLTFAAGTDITISGNSGTDTLTISSSLDKQALINTASAAAYASASGYTNFIVDGLDTLDIEENTNLYFTNQRAIDATYSLITSASANALFEANEYTNSASSSLVGYVNTASSSLVNYTDSASASLIAYTNSASSSLVAYTNQEVSALQLFSNISTSPSTQLITGDSNSDTLTFIAGENISINADSSTDSITINSTGNYTNVDSVTYPDYIVFDTTPENTSASTSTLAWDSGEGGLGLQLNANTQVTLGQEIIVLCNNGEATTLNKGEVVRFSGASGQKPQVTRAYNTSDAGSALTFGIVAESIASGAEGFVVTQGIVKNINTNAYNEGDILYLSASAGVLTTVKPQAPNHYVFVGVVIKKNSSSGRIYVKPQNGYELDEIHDVRISGVANDDLIVYNSASSIWVNSPKQDLITTASAAAFASASAYTNTSLIPYLTQSSASSTYIPLSASASFGGGGAISVSSTAPASASEGDGWFDNTDGKFYVYDGTFWVESAPTDAAYASYNRWTKVLSGSASIITGLSDNGVTLDYTPGQESLYINGIFIDRDSYTATSGSSIILDEISFSGDVIEIVWLDNIAIADIANIYLKTEQDNLFLTQVSASNTYLTQNSASNTYTTLTQFNNIDLTSTINTASAAAYASASAYTNSASSSLVTYTNTQVNAGINTASAAAVNYLIDSAPGTLDTLNELSAALNDDPNFYSTIQSVYLTQSSASTQYEKLIPYSTSTPTSPVTGDMWLDSNSTPPALKVYDGSNWVQLGAAVDDSQAIIAGRMFA
jgi:hypothetical protein